MPDGDMADAPEVDGFHGKGDEQTTSNAPAT
jgi:hypothetical protein